VGQLPVELTSFIGRAGVSVTPLGVSTWLVREYRWLGGTRLYSSATILSMEMRLGILPWDRRDRPAPHEGAARRLVELDYGEVRVRAVVTTRLPIMDAA
jgi:hypothetical protein